MALGDTRLAEHIKNYMHIIDNTNKLNAIIQMDQIY